MYEVTMPKLSDSMEVGRIIEWKVKEGDEVREGDVLAEIESDKAVMELECFRAGVVSKILRAGDSEVSVGEPIAVIDEAARVEKAPLAKAAPDKKTAPAPARPAPVSAAEAPKPVEATPPKVKEKPPAPAPRPTTERVAISPFARKLAQKLRVDYTRVAGSGPGGRIVERDIEAAAPPLAAQRAVKPSPDEELAPLEVAPDEAEIEEAPFRMKTQIRRVSASKHVIPHFYITLGADVTRLLSRKEDLKRNYGATVTHLVMWACIRAIEKHPLVNRAYDRGKIFKWNAVNLGLAIETGEGLTVAVVRDAQKLPLRDLVNRTKELVEKARAGRLSAEERLHPGFTITNLGMYDVDHFQPIINPPSSITLAVGSALEAPVVHNGIIYVSKVMKLSAACDHRIIEGALAARFMKTLKDLLENPDALLDGIG